MSDYSPHDPFAEAKRKNKPTSNKPIPVWRERLWKVYLLLGTLFGLYITLAGLFLLDHRPAGAYVDRMVGLDVVRGDEMNFLHGFRLT